MRRMLLALARGSIEPLVLAFCAEDATVLSRIRPAEVARRIEAGLEGLPLGYLLAMALLMIWISGHDRRLESWAESRLSWKRTAVYALKFAVLKEIYSEPALLMELGYGAALKRRREGIC